VVGGVPVLDGLEALTKCKIIKLHWNEVVRCSSTRGTPKQPNFQEYTQTTLLRNHQSAEMGIWKKCVDIGALLAPPKYSAAGEFLGEEVRKNAVCTGDLYPSWPKQGKKMRFLMVPVEWWK
jgi:hypothetical protein